MSVTTLTRRERIMEEVARRLGEMTQGDPVSDPYLTTLEFVSRGASLEGLHSTYRTAAAILDADENKTPKINQMDCQLRVTVEFFAYVDTNQTPSSAGNKILGDIQRKMREDIHLTEPDDGRPVGDRQLSEHIVEVGNQLFIDGVSDTQITGAITYNITYKHGINDPRVLVSAL